MTSRGLDSNPLHNPVNVSVSDVLPTPPQTADARSPPASKRFLDLKRASSTPPETTNENSLRNSSKIRGANFPLPYHPAMDWERQQLSKKRSQYYGELFAYREPHNNAKDRFTRDSVIVAEIKLNCKVSPGRMATPGSTDSSFSSKWSKRFCPTCPFSYPRSINVRSPV
jgi:hypothetical protein